MEQNNTTVYLLRHAESQPDSSIPQEEWPLSPRGQQQALDLARHLSRLDVSGIYSSPCLRALDTVRPFATQARLEINIHHDLRERMLQDGWAPDFRALARRTWEDFSFAGPGGESNAAAQARMMHAIHEIAGRHAGATVLVVSHGNGIGLVLNSIDPAFGWAEAVAMRNPDLFKIEVCDGLLIWDRSVRLESKGP